MQIIITILIKSQRTMQQREKQKNIGTKILKMLATMLLQHGDGKIKETAKGLC